MTLAIIAPIKVRKHPDADRIQLGDVCGFQVVVGLDVQDGDIGIFFREGLQLSQEYVQANDLVRRKNPDGTPAGGFFEETRRVRCQKFRKEKSEGYWAPLTSLEVLGSTSDLKIGDRLEAFAGKPLCNKYITPATYAARNRTKSHRKETEMFKAHFETDQFRLNKHRFKPNSFIVATLKMHGTSQRVGYVKDTVKLSIWQQWLNKLLPIFKLKDWRYLIGSRNVILEPNKNGYYSSKFREDAATPFIGNLHKGETIFYEVVGYEEFSKPIMGRQTVKDSEIKKYYGSEVTYRYGCPDGTFDIYVYRITMTNEDGVSTDLTWDAVKKRCAELLVKHVPELFTFHILSEDDVGLLEQHVEKYVDGPDLVDPTHPREGLCLRLESSHPEIFKHKSFTFGVLEGYIKDQPDYVDAEESA